MLVSNLSEPCPPFNVRHLISLNTNFSIPKLRKGFNDLRKFILLPLRSISMKLKEIQLTSVFKQLSYIENIGGYSDDIQGDILGSITYSCNNIMYACKSCEIELFSL